MKNSRIKEIKAAVIGVKIQPKPIFASRLKLIFLPPLARPSPKTAPTTACELDTGTRGKEGKFIINKKSFKVEDANTKSVVELAKTTIKAPIGEISMMLDPTVSITLFE